MEQKTIYVRTPSGEEAVAQRTRIVQRNLRNVLDLVDGKRTVEEIIRKFGDATIAEAALADLERSGFVATEAALAARGPRTEGPKPAAGEESTAEKIARIRKESLAAIEDEDITIMDPLEFQAAGTAAKTSKEPWLPGGLDEPGEDLSEIAAAAAAEQPPSFAEDTGPARAEERVRGRKWGRWVLGAVAALLLAVAAGVVFFPYEYYLPRVELRVRDSIGEPVRLAAMRPAISPRPGIRIERLRVGVDDALVVDRVYVVPTAGSVLAANKVLDEVILDGVHADASALPRIAEWFRSGRYFVVRKLRFNRAELKLGSNVVAGLSGEAIFDERGQLQELRFVDAAGSLAGRLTPKDGGFVVRLKADEWKVPDHEWIRLTTFEAEGMLGGAQMRLDRFDGRSFDGLISGTALLDWTRGVQFSAEVQVKGIGLGSLLPAVRKDLLASGDMNGTFAISGNADKFARIGGVASVQGDFEVSRGVLSNFDFAEALRSLTPGATRGGQTRFDRATGSFRRDGDLWIITGLVLEAGLMGAAGSLDIGSADVSGALAVAFQGGSGARANVRVTGKLPDPYLTASR
jgi:hypothetical protein